MSSESVIILSSILMAIFSAIFDYQLKELRKRNFTTGSNPLLFKMLSIMRHVHQNIPSSFIALARLDSSRQMLPPQLRSLAWKLSLGYRLETKTFDLPPFMGFSDPFTRNEQKINEHMFQEIIGDLRRRLFTTNIRNIVTLIITGITITPVVVIISALFYQKGILEVLPIVTSLFYGIVLQLIVVVLKRYASVLV